MSQTSNVVVAFVLLLAMTTTLVRSTQSKVFSVNTHNVTGKWNHFYERCVGSGHALLATRADYQSQLTQTNKELGFQQVRFHGIFADDMSVVLPQGDSYVYSFFNIDRVFDFLLGINMKPFVEISFMPKALASGNKTWSHFDANVTPPKSWDEWHNLVYAFGQHIVERYGLEEVSQWNFEVWNEPNCCPNNFWTGTKEDYFNLYFVTARALKAVSPKLRVGGPATAMSAWVQDFLDYCAKNDAPVDFVSTHLYPTDPPGPQTRTFFSDHLKQTRAIVGDFMPLYYTEYDDGYNDMTAYSAAFVVYQNYMANGVVDALSWWPFSDIFEEAGLFPDPFNEKWMPVDGLMNVYGVPKPNYRAFQLLHWAGDKLVDTQPNLFNSNSETVGVFAVTGNNTSVFIVNWNVKHQPIEDAQVTINVSGTMATKALLYSIDSINGNALPTWVKMGRPAYLTPQQVRTLSDASELIPAPIALKQLASNTVTFSVNVPANTVANVVLQ